MKKLQIWLYVLCFCGFTVTVNADSIEPAAPVIKSLWPTAPAVPAGVPLQLNLRVTDANGSHDITHIYLHIGPSLDAKNAFRLFYAPVGGKFLVRNDDNTEWLDDADGDRVIANSQASVDLRSVSGVTSSNEIELSLKITAQPRWQNTTQNIYLLVRDRSGRFDGFRQMGTWQIRTGLQISNLSVSEGNSGTQDAIFHVTLNQALSQQVTVNYATEDIRAHAGSDYDALSGQLTFAPGETSKIIRVAVRGDTLPEEDENFAVRLSNATGTAIIKGRGTGVILNDDRAQIAPVNISVSPGAPVVPAGVPLRLNARFKDDNGSHTIASAMLHIGSSLDAHNAFRIYIGPAGGKFLVRNDDDTAWLDDADGDGIISNSQGSLDLRSAKVDQGSYEWSVAITLTAQARWQNTTQNIYLYVRDKSGLQSGFTRMGTWHIRDNARPTNDSLAPTQARSAPGVAQTFTTTYSDADGAGNIAYVMVYIGASASSPQQGLQGYYNPNSNKLYLRNSANTEWLGGFTPGSNNVISNSQGTLNCAATTVSISGDTLTVNWNFTPSNVWAGTTQNVFLYVRDKGSLSDGFDHFGQWAISR